MEGTLSNLSRQVMRPPGCSGKAKRGHLCFDASFETGNLGRVDFVAEYDYDLFIRPDTCNPRSRFWFNFTVDNAKADQRAIFNLVNLHKSRNLFWEGLTPLVRSTSRPRWTRLPAENVYYYQSEQHRGHYILSFAFCFDTEHDVYQFALTFPYSYARLQAFLQLQDNARLPFYWRHTLAYTVMKRRCDILTITSLHNYRGPIQAMTEARGAAVEAATKAAVLPTTHHRQHDDDDDDEDESDHVPASLGSAAVSRRVVVVMTRVHGGESPTSFIVQGMVELLVGSSSEAQVLREHVVFKIIPMMNPDGVYLGNYRSTLMGFDLNRSWNDASVWGHPTVHAARSMLLELDQAEWCDLDLVLDLHAHSSLLGTFIYGNSYDDVYRHERHIVFPKMLSHCCEDYCHYNTIYNKDPSKAHSARRWLCSNLKDSANVYSIHTSIYGYRNQRGHIVPYTEDLYLRTGRSIVKAVLDYYQFLGLIPYTFPSAQPLHDLPRGKGPASPPLHTRHSRSHLSLQQARTPHCSSRSKWSPGGKERGSRALTKLPDVKGPGGSEAAATDTAASGSTDDASSVSSDSDGLSDTSGLMVRIKQKAASADEEDVGYTRRYGHERNDRNVRLPAARHTDNSRALEGRDRRRTSRKTRQPRTTYMTLFPEQQMNHPSRSDDDTRSLPDLPSLTASLPTLRTTPDRRHRPPFRLVGRQARPTTLVWQDLQQPLQHRDIKLSYRYYDFKRLTRPRKKRHKKKPKSRSPSRTRSQRRNKTTNAKDQNITHHNPTHHNSSHNNPTHHSSSHHNPTHHSSSHHNPTHHNSTHHNSPERGRRRRIVVGGGFNVTRLATPPREETGTRPPAQRGLRMIDVNQLTIGGYQENVSTPRWQASPRRHTHHLPTTPPLLRRFLDPHASLF
ncbi:cytosolic carboxypeptidase-like protein 5 [Cherax quadricarinatus]